VMGSISIRGQSGGAECDVFARKQGGVCVHVECMDGVLEGAELGPNPMPFCFWVFLLSS